jgi:hypothetical protein
MNAAMREDTAPVPSRTPGTSTQRPEEITMSRTHFFAAAFAAAFVAGSTGEFIVRAVEARAYVTLYTLERVSDGERIDVEIGGRGGKRADVAAGTIVVATRAGAGAELSVGGERIGYVPEAFARALLEARAVA